VFGPVMNITGSTLALWWRSKPIEEPTKSERSTNSNTSIEKTLSR
jgi:hypothetical protein